MIWINLKWIGENRARFNIVFFFNDIAGKNWSTTLYRVLIAMYAPFTTSRNLSQNFPCSFLGNSNLYFEYFSIFLTHFLDQI